MKMFAWILTGSAALLGLAMPGTAQSPPSSAPAVNEPAAYFQRPRPCPSCPPSVPAPPVLLPPVDPSKPVTPAPAPADTPPAAEALPTGGQYKSSYGMGAAVSAGFGIGASVASGAAGFPIPAANMRVATISSTPLIMPGLFTAIGAQSVVPVDRVSFDYGYYNGFAIVTGGGTTPGFNLNQFNISVEKTFLDGIGSVYVSVPFLDATQNISGQAINGLGDVTAGFKFVIWKDRETGSLFSGGMTVAAPTAQETRITNTLNINFTGGPTPAGFGTPPPVGPLPPLTSTTTVNPTFLQPWVGGLIVLDKLFFHEYFGVVVPTDDRVATILNNNLTIGYNLFSDPNSFVSSITPVFSAQVLVPVTNINNSTGSTTASVNIPCTTTTYPADQLPTRFGFPDQVFLTAGVQIGLGERALFSAGVVTPVVGPRGYAVGGTVGLTYFY